MKKEGLNKGVVRINKTFLLSLFLFIVLLLSLSFVQADFQTYTGIRYIPSSSTSASTATTPQAPQVFTLTDSKTWYLDGKKAAELLKSNKEKFLAGARELIKNTKEGYVSSELNQLWTKMLASGDITSVSSLGKDGFVQLWDKLSYNNAAETMAKFKGKEAELFKIMTPLQISRLAQVAYTEKNSLGGKISDDPKENTAAIASLKAIRKDLLLAAHKYYSEKDKSGKEVNQFFLDLWKPLQGKDGKIPDVSGITNLMNTLNEKDMESVRETFAKAVVHDKLPKDKTGKPKYAGLQKLDLGSDKFKLGFENGEISLMYDKTKVLDLANAQIWANNIIVKDGVLSLSTTIGSSGSKTEVKTLKFTSSDLSNLKSPISFNIEDGKSGYGDVTINGLVFNPYYGSDSKGIFNIKVSEKEVKLTAISSGGKPLWIRSKNNFYTMNEETKGDFEVRIQNTGELKTPNQVSYCKNADSSVILQEGFNSYNADGTAKTQDYLIKNVRVLNFRIGDKETAVLNINQKTPSGLTGYIGVDSAKSSSSTIPIPGATVIPSLNPWTPGSSSDTAQISGSADSECAGCTPGSCGPGGCGPQTQPVTPTITSPTIPQTQTQSSPDFSINLNGVSNIQVLGQYAGTTEKYAMTVDSGSSNIEVARFSNRNQISISSGNSNPVPYSDDPVGGFVINPVIAGLDIKSRYAQVLASIGLVKISESDFSGISGTTDGRIPLRSDSSMDGQANVNPSAPKIDSGSSGSTAQKDDEGWVDASKIIRDAAAAKEKEEAEKKSQNSGTGDWTKAGNWASKPALVSAIQSAYPGYIPKSGDKILFFYTQGSGCGGCRNFERDIPLIRANNPNLKIVTVSTGGTAPTFNSYGYDGTFLGSAEGYNSGTFSSRLTGLLNL
ncbi:MAG: hypothetical protein WC402_03425 [Candidatus Pacearchaeota archaeon]|jgi:hypothetical protein